MKGPWLAWELGLGSGFLGGPSMKRATKVERAQLWERGLSPFERPCGRSLGPKRRRVPKGVGGAVMEGYPKGSRSAAFLIKPRGSWSRKLTASYRGLYRAARGFLEGKSPLGSGDAQEAEARAPWKLELVESLRLGLQQGRDKVAGHGLTSRRFSKREDADELQEIGQHGAGRSLTGLALLGGARRLKDAAVQALRRGRGLSLVTGLRRVSGWQQRLRVEKLEEKRASKKQPRKACRRRRDCRSGNGCLGRSSVGRRSQVSKGRGATSCSSSQEAGLHYQGEGGAAV